METKKYHTRQILSRFIMLFVIRHFFTALEICAFFYGSPGIGKTETAQQLVKATGRGIVHVDISQSKPCWFGESEKSIKKIFQDIAKFLNQ